MQSPAPVCAASNLGRRRGIVEEGGGYLDDVVDDHDGRLVWAEERRKIREGREEAIKRGVERLRMDRQAEEVEEPHAGLPSEDDDDDGAGEAGDGNGGYAASPSQNSDGGGKGSKTKATSENGRGRLKKAQAKANDGEGDGEAEEKRNFWIGNADVGAGGEDEDEGSTRGSSQTSGSPHGFGKRKSTRQQTFKAMTECMDKHGALMAATMESANNRQCSIQLQQCEALEAEVQGMDSGRVSYERLKSLAEAMRYLLAAAAWIMRMAGDDTRSHFDAWVFVQLTSKTTLLAAMDRHFDSRRHVLLAATVMTEKLGRPPPTFAPPPLYIPDMASKCGDTFVVVFPSPSWKQRRRIGSA
ncbi:hypothetical protein CBR_g23388 [Chara braunii]|uniref:Uncharacterized protein n=1 Tax=Chara braunii TaxID=69332 RepID=A0A388L493_CHABU|nr:hypothetical protein CBR_g23388 [Chara braunii]|eukprot:GBG77062.1 hypothetical protein CBR_g23388 [Chara braunii]